MPGDELRVVVLTDLELAVVRRALNPSPDVRLKATLATAPTLEESVERFDAARHPAYPRDGRAAGLRRQQYRQALLAALSPDKEEAERRRPARRGRAS